MIESAVSYNSVMKPPLPKVPFPDSQNIPDNLKTKLQDESVEESGGTNKEGSVTFSYPNGCPNTNPDHPDYVPSIFPNAPNLQGTVKFHQKTKRKKKEPTVDPAVIDMLSRLQQTGPGMKPASGSSSNAGSHSVGSAKDLPNTPQIAVSILGHNSSGTSSSSVRIFDESSTSNTPSSSQNILKNSEISGSSSQGAGNNSSVGNAGQYSEAVLYNFLKLASITSQAESVPECKPTISRSSSTCSLPGKAEDPECNETAETSVDIKPEPVSDCETEDRPEVYIDNNEECLENQPEPVPQSSILTRHDIRSDESLSHNHMKTLLNTLQCYHNDGFLCDTELITIGRIFNVHSVVLSAFSPTFHNFFKTYAKVEKYKLRLLGFHSSVVDVVVKYIYSGNLKTPEGFVVERDSETLVQAFQAFGISLKDILEKIEAVSNTGVRNTNAVTSTTKSKATESTSHNQSKTSTTFQKKKQKLNTAASIQETVVKSEESWAGESEFTSETKVSDPDLVNPEKMETSVTVKVEPEDSLSAEPASNDNNVILSAHNKVIDPVSFSANITSVLSRKRKNADSESSEKLPSAGKTVTASKKSNPKTVKTTNSKCSTSAVSSTGFTLGTGISSSSTVSEFTSGGGIVSTQSKSSSDLSFMLNLINTFNRGLVNPVNSLAGVPNIIRNSTPLITVGGTNVAQVGRNIITLPFSPPINIPGPSSTRETLINQALRRYRSIVASNTSNTQACDNLSTPENSSTNTVQRPSNDISSSNTLVCSVATSCNQANLSTTGASVTSSLNIGITSNSENNDIASTAPNTEDTSSQGQISASYLFAETTGSLHLQCETDNTDLLTHDDDTDSAASTSTVSVNESVDEDADSFDD